MVWRRSAPHMWMRAGDFAHISPNVPHLPYNASERIPCVGLVARTDPNEQESVTLLNIRSRRGGEIEVRPIVRMVI